MVVMKAEMMVDKLVVMMVLTKVGSMALMKGEMKVDLKVD